MTPPIGCRVAVRRPAALLQTRDAMAAMIVLPMTQSYRQPKSIRQLQPQQLQLQLQHPKPQLQQLQLQPG